MTLAGRGGLLGKDAPRRAERSAPHPAYGNAASLLSATGQARPGPHSAPLAASSAHFNHNQVSKTFCLASRLMISVNQKARPHCVNATWTCPRHASATPRSAASTGPAQGDAGAGRTTLLLCQENNNSLILTMVHLSLRRLMEFEQEFDLN